MQVANDMDDRETITGRCPACLSTRLKHKRVRSAFWNGRRLVLVEGVPVLICTECGEHVYDDAAVAALDDMKCGGFPPAKAARFLQVPIFDYPLVKGNSRRRTT